MERVVILGTAHGANVAGKQSPDGEFKESEYSRKVISLIKHRLVASGLIVYVDIPQDIVPTPQRTELKTRCSIANALCSRYGAENCIYVSVHVNAGGDGSEWLGAGGWCAYTTKGATKADVLAECLYEAAAKSLKEYEEIMRSGKLTGAYTQGQRPFRRDKTDGDQDHEEDFYVLQHTICPAVLTENLFQDNKSDVAYLISESGINGIVDLHVNGITKYFTR